MKKQKSNRLFSILIISLFALGLQAPESGNSTYPNPANTKKSSVSSDVSQPPAFLQNKDLHSETSSSLPDFEETWWIISDSHIGTDQHALPRLEAAIADANALGLSQRAINLGDLVHDDPIYTAPYEDAMNELDHPWFDVLGNHDFDRYGDGARIKDRTFFSETVAGVRFIYLSDDGMWNGGNVTEGYQTEKNLMQDQNNWFRAQLDDDPDIPTILMTHQGLRRMYEVAHDDGPCFWDTSRRGWLQDNWGQYNIPMWIRGHRHTWALEENYQGHGFVDVSPGAVSTSYGGGIFMTIKRENGTTTLSFRFRNHDPSWRWVGGYEEYTFEMITAIHDWHDLNDIRNNLDGNYILMNDLDEDTPGYSTYNSGSGWNPIGSYSGSPFTGSLNGRGYTISGLTFSNTSSTYVGLFEYADEAHISNLGLVNVDITASEHIGAIAGRIDNSYVSNSFAEGSITAHGTINNGGLFGSARVSGQGRMVITQSWANVNMTQHGSASNERNLGGLVGYLTADAEIIDSYARGNISGNNRLGGLVGLSTNDASIIRSYATGSVSGASSVGGLVGHNTASVSNSYWDTTTSGTTTGIGSGTTTGATGRTTSQMKTQSTFSGWDFTNIWSMDSSINNGYPFLQGSQLPVNEIYDWHDLDAVRNNLWHGYVLMNNLDEDTPGYSDYNSGNGWDPIGSYSGSPFTGTFDGNGYAISGLTINDSGNAYGGLFAYVVGANVSDLGIINANITGASHQGLLAGRADDSIIERVYVAGKIEIGTVRINVGGMLGSAREASMSIDQCFAVVDITMTGEGTTRNIGGLVGFLTDGAGISNSYARGNIAGWAQTGGLVGLMSQDGTSVTNSYATGIVTGTDSHASYGGYGGLVGYISTSGVTVTNSFFNSSNNEPGAAGTGKTTTQMKSASTFTGEGWDFNTVWDNSGDLSYPWLRFENDIPPIQITSWNSLNRVRQKLEGKYILKKNIDSNTDDYSGIGNSWTPLGTGDLSFTGTFDGDGHTISDLEISGGGEAGFIGYAENATVLDLGLVNVDITATDSWAGALMSYGVGDITISNCYSTGKVTSSGRSGHGGLVGRLDGEHAIISRSFSTASVNVTYTPDPEPARWTGGLVGYLREGTIEDSYARGHVYSVGVQVGGLVGRMDSSLGEYGHIYRSYSMGTVAGSDNVGGLVGRQWNHDKVNNSFWDVDVSGQSDSEGGTPLPHIEMKEGDTFSAWDFGDIWDIEEGHSYPYLQWEGIETAPNEVTSWTGLDNMGDNPHRYYYLSDSLDAGSAGYDDNWSPISGFTGLFDGNNYIIDDFIMDAGGNAGFFSSTDGAAILNVAMRNVDVKNTTSTNTTGTLAGTAASTNFFNCSITGTFQTTTTAHRAGGLVGYAEGNTTIRRCWTSVDMDVPSSQQAGGLVGRMVDDGLVAESFTTGNVNGSTSTGGLLGRVRHNSQIINSYARGNVSGGSEVGGLIGRIWDAGVSVTNSYSTGYVDGSSNDGGLIGQSAGTVSNSFYDNQTSGMGATSAGGTGQTRANMRKASTFTSAGWDFNNIWAIDEDKSYPYLQENNPTPDLDWLGVDTGTPLRPHWFSYNAERGMAIVEEGESTLILVPSVLTYSDDVHIHIIDAETGKDAGFMNLDEYNTGEASHALHISDVAVSDDNKIFISNYVDILGQDAFRVQMYEDTGGNGHVTVLEDPRTSDGDWSLARTITITGSYTLGTATLYAVSDAGNHNQLVRYTQTGPGETFGNSEVISSLQAVGSNPTASAARPGTAPFYQTGGGQPVRKYDADGTLIGTIPLEIAPEGTNRVQFLGTSDAGDDYIAVYDYDDAHALLIKVPDDDPTAAEVLTTTALLGSAPNPDGTGDIRFVDTGDGFDVYLLATNNGIKATRMDWEDITLTTQEDLHVGGTDRGWRMFSMPVGGVTIKGLSDQYFVQGFGPDLFPRYGPNILFVDAEANAWSAKGRDQNYEFPAGEGFIWFFYNGETGGYPNDHPLPVWLSVDGLTPGDDIEAYSLAQGSNLIGNPFNRDLHIYEDIYNVWANGGELGSVDVQVWDNYTNNGHQVDPENGGYSHSGTWRVIGETGQHGQKIAPWQGFVIDNLGPDPATEITIPKSAAPRFRGRERGFYKSEEKPFWHRLSFSLVNIQANGNRMVTDEAASLLFHPEASEGWDIYDAGKMTPISDRFATLSFLGERNGESILKAQESRPLDFEGQIEIPVSFESYELAGSFEIKWGGLDELPEEWYLMLADHEAGTLTDLRLEESLVFSIEEPLRRSSARDGETQKGFASGGAPAQLSVEELAGSEVLPFMESLSLPVHFSGLRKYGTKGSATRFTLIVSTEPISGEILADLPEEVELSQNYPNPFNPVTVLPYALPEESHVRLTIYDVLGRQVAVLVDGVKEAGRYEVSWDATRQASGVYIYRLEAGGEAFTRKMTLVK